MRLPFLAPRIVEAIVDGRLPADLTTLAMTQRIEHYGAALDFTIDNYRCGRSKASGKA
jgi:hypothetical protein